MLKVRLSRRGRKGRPFYRIVVAEASKPRDGKVVAHIGTYDPQGTHYRGDRIRLDWLALHAWLDAGAKMTPAVKNLARQFRRAPNHSIQIEAYERLIATGRYKELIKRRRQANKKRSFTFELIFASLMEANGAKLEYEKSVKHGSDKSIDFTMAAEDCEVLMELVSPELSEALEEDRAAQLRRKNKTHSEIDIVQSLSKDAQDERMTPAAETIRLQRKLCEKVEKLPAGSQDHVSILVVDCSNIHSGAFDEEDARTCMTGKTRNKAWEEQLPDGGRVKGLTEEDCPTRDAAGFQDKVSAVVFVRDQGPNFLEDAIITINPKRETVHQELTLETIKSTPLSNCQLIPLVL